MIGLLIVNIISIILSFKEVAVISCEKMLLFQKISEVRCCEVLPCCPPFLTAFTFAFSDSLLRLR